MMISAPNYSEIGEIWQDIESILAPAVARTSGRMLPQDVLDAALREKVQVLIASEGDEIYGVVVAQPLQYARRRALAIMFVAGRDHKLWDEGMNEAIEKTARRAGCDLIEGLGRKGFDRVMPGYRVVAVSYEKDLI